MDGQQELYPGEAGGEAWRFVPCRPVENFLNHLALRMDQSHD